ncbi:aminotransferase class I/II-fold pyridoxal phosphate-dependent enzyme [Williamsia sp. CHRR-6]|uniref:aminotransferase class I/II-fold pyridoxal phosphate-dependent enzyme n=1 Tax=Williamsia sp. CHRR-6 TaxID=2835871 RepID=UPI001BDAD625|nr:aminotransferase class I/II-fold pyridoxal phosphate-dependent enzyme [Williamsia sp. CHRR-6]MBT0566882.1 aminotransferase class I/II-fold pyridoxal phosphate-dependent enzyme [Williamsia sp. CHRR-6]
MARAASHRSDIEMFHVMDVLAAAAARREQGLEVVSLAAGQPSTPAPAPVLAAVRAALDADPLGYTESLGTSALREAIAGHHRRLHGIDVSASDVVVTTGSSGAFTLIFLAAFDIGDQVAMARPGYPAYRNTLAALGCEVIELDCGPATRYAPTPAMLDALDSPPAGLIVASPANPTGTVLAPDELAALARWCDAHGTLLISDEIYHGIEYGIEYGSAGDDSPIPATSSAWSTSRESVVVGSVSKYFSMTGWRLGWMLVPARYRRAVERLTANMTICPPAIAQAGALAAFGPESIAECNSHVRRYATNRRLLLDGLAGLGVTDIAPPDGAFYLYADIAHLTDDSLTWCRDVLAETGVAVTPGVDFDSVAGGHTVRMSFAGSTAEVDRALDLLQPVLRRS